MRGLVADSHAPAVFAISQMLKANRFEIDRTDLASEAIHLSTRNQYDIVLFDFVLPDLSGRHLVRRMRHANPSRPMLVMSSMDQAQARPAALEAGADGFMAKPFGETELLTRIRRLFADRGLLANRAASRMGRADSRAIADELVCPVNAVGAPDIWRGDADARGGDPVSGGDKRGSVLMVEDESTVAKTLRCALEAGGYSVDQAWDVHRALALLRNHPPATVLLDCHLPDGGMEEIMAMANQRGAIVVLLSSDREMLSLLAAFGYPTLHRLFRTSELLETVGRSQKRASRLDVPSSFPPVPDTNRGGKSCTFSHSQLTLTAPSPTMVPSEVKPSKPWKR